MCCPDMSSNKSCLQSVYRKGLQGFTFSSWKKDRPRLAALDNNAVQVSDGFDNTCRADG